MSVKIIDLSLKASEIIKGTGSGDCEGIGAYTEKD